MSNPTAFLSPLFLLPGLAMLVNNKRRFILIIFASFSHTSAFTDVEVTKKTIIITLKQEQPLCVEEFSAFFTKYDALVLNFFDEKNRAPLKTHIEHMEAELQTLTKVCRDTRYRSIHPLLYPHHTHLLELVALLKQYIGSKDTLSLALKIRKFKKILPEAIRKRGNVALFSALRHRLTCG